MSRKLPHTDAKQDKATTSSERKLIVTRGAGQIAFAAVLVMGIVGPLVLFVALGESALAVMRDIAIGISILVDSW